VLRRRPDAQVGGVVRLSHPEAEDVGAVLADDLLGGDGVADGFRHLHAVLVEREAVGQHRLVGRAASRAAGLEERGLEPAAVLVGALEVEIGRPHAVGAVPQREGVGGAGVEPDVEDVGHLLPGFVREGAEEALARALRVPGVGAFGLEGVLDAGVDLRVAQDLDPALAEALDEAGERHAPGALA
jgi:hypothetical protein